MRRRGENRRQQTDDEWKTDKLQRQMGLDMKQEAKLMSDSAKYPFFYLYIMFFLY